MEVRGEEGGAGSCYVVREGARVWVWCAASATGDEREVAKNMAAAEHTLVMQGTCGRGVDRGYQGVLTTLGTSYESRKFSEGP